MEFFSAVQPKSSGEDSSEVLDQSTRAEVWPACASSQAPPSQDVHGEDSILQELGISLPADEDSEWEKWFLCSTEGDACKGV
eukprot:755976-Hanusia_phi.AAC.4